MLQPSAKKPNRAPASWWIIGMLAVLAVAVLAMGLYPKPFTDVMHVSVTELIKHAAVSKLPTP